MKLATRISLFFLAALALVLVGLSASIYGLVRSHLFNQVNERLIAGLETFRGAMEFESHGLDWEPEVRRRYFLEAQATGPMVWGVFQPNGHQVDGSIDAPSLFAQQLRADGDFKDGESDISWRDQTWRIIQETLRSESFSQRPGPNKPSAAEPDNRPRYSVLMIIVGVPLDPALRPLQSLTVVLVVTSLAIWLFAAAMGRWMCAKALAPVTRMARTAQSISAADLSWRLPSPGTGDELEELSGAFNDLLNRLQISFQRQQQFAAQASHQLRTPLTAMFGQLDVALRRERNPEEYRRALESVHRQAAQLRHIVEMLLYLTREDAESAPLEFEPLDLHAWLTGHMLGWAQHSRGDDIRIETAPGGTFWVKAHGGLLGQAVDNLLENSCKYSEPGSPIVVRIGRQENTVWLAVEDHGYGVAAKELPHVFEPFFRSEESRQRGISGIGMGLAVVHRIIAAFNGRIEVQSETGKGARFTMYLPAMQHEQVMQEVAVGSA